MEILRASCVCWSVLDIIRNQYPVCKISQPLAAILSIAVGTELAREVWETRRRQRKEVVVELAPGTEGLKVARAG